MTPLPALLLTHICRWPTPVQQRLLSMRGAFHDVAAAAGIGPLEESLKWGQPAWRPSRARTGSTLRLNWSETTASMLLAYVDCKTDLATQMQIRFPEIPSDGRRELRFSLDRDDDDAIWQLAHLTFTYHAAKRASAR